MEFKVGDKVRARRDLFVNKKYGKLYLVPGMGEEIGEITTVIDITDEGNYVCDNGWIWSEEMLEPIKGWGKGMKKYKTSEAIAMLEKNPDMIFTAECGSNSYKFCVKRGYFYFKVFRKGELISQSLGAGAFNGNIHIDLEWELIQQPVDFMEAVKAYSEGKTIRCEFYGTPYIFNPIRHESKIGHGAWLRSTRDTILSSGQILQGQWYVEDSNE